MGAEEIRIDERKQEREPDEHGCGSDPPPAAKLAREPHDDREREAEEDELAAEREPIAEHERRVADVREPVVALPPEIDDRERQLGRPDEREAEHPEQHPRADRPGRRLACPAGAPARVRGERCDLREHSSPRQERLDGREARRGVQLSSGEEPMRVDVRKMEGRRDSRAPEQPRGYAPHRRRGNEQRRAPDHAASANSCCGDAAPSSGLACGYASVRSRR